MDDNIFEGFVPPRKSKSWEQARADRETGMAHAEQGQEEWMEEATHFAAVYVEGLPVGRTFMAEDIVDAARDQMDGTPRDPRAWGPVIKRVEKMGLIAKAGYAPARTSNTSPKVRWAKL